MALRTDKSIFYHIPKAGGIWVRKVISAIGLNERETVSTQDHSLGLIKKHTTYEQTLDEDKKGLFSYCFVRNPVDWYQSFWNFRLDREGGPLIRRRKFYAKFRLDNLWSDDFDEFIDNVIKEIPEGFVTNLYKYYVGENCDKVDFIGRTENLRKDFAKALEMAGEKTDLELINKKPKRNTSWKKEEINPVTKQKILETESWVINNFYKKYD